MGRLPVQRADALCRLPAHPAHFNLHHASFCLRERTGHIGNQPENLPYLSDYRHPAAHQRVPELTLRDIQRTRVTEEPSAERHLPDD